MLFLYYKLPKRERGCTSEWAAGGPRNVFVILATALLAALYYIKYEKNQKFRNIRKLTNLQIKK